MSVARIAPEPGTSPPRKRAKNRPTGEDARRFDGCCGRSKPPRPKISSGHSETPSNPRSELRGTADERLNPCHSERSEESSVRHVAGCGCAYPTGFFTSFRMTNGQTGACLRSAAKNPERASPRGTARDYPAGSSLRLADPVLFAAYSLTSTPLAVARMGSRKLVGESSRPNSGQARESRARSLVRARASRLLTVPILMPRVRPM